MRILFVDDDANILSSHQRNLRKQFNIQTALGPEEGLAAIDRQGPFAAIVADMQMPGMNGVQFLIRAQERTPDSVRLMLTGAADQRTAMDAVNHGQVFRFLTKPCTSEELTRTLDMALEQYRMVMAERALLENTINGSVKLLTDVLSSFDPQSFGRARKLRELMQIYLSTHASPHGWEYQLAAMLSSVGRVTIPPDLLKKARQGLRLTEAEQTMLRRVPEIGRDLLANIPRLESVAEIILYQNKNFDGTGDPQNAVSGEEIPFGARLLRILSDFTEREEQGELRAAVFEEMQQLAALYDLRLLNAVAACFNVHLPSGSQGHSGSAEVMLSDLKVGQLLASDVLTFGGSQIATSGTRVSEMLLVKLRNYAEMGGIREPLSVSTAILEGGQK